MGELEDILRDREFSKGISRTGGTINEYESDLPPSLNRIGSRPTGPVVNRVSKVGDYHDDGDLFGDDDEFWGDDDPEEELSFAERQELEAGYDEHADDGAYSVQAKKKEPHNYMDFMNEEEQDYGDRQYGQDFGKDDLNLKPSDTRSGDDMKEKRKAVLRRLQGLGYDFSDPDDRQEATLLLKEAGLL